MVDEVYILCTYLAATYLKDVQLTMYLHPLLLHDLCVTAEAMAYVPVWSVVHAASSTLCQPMTTFLYPLHKIAKSTYAFIIAFRCVQVVLVRPIECGHFSIVLNLSFLILNFKPGF